MFRAQVGIIQLLSILYPNSVPPVFVFLPHMFCERGGAVGFVVGRLLEDGTLSSLVGFLLTIEVRRSVNI